MTDLTEQWKKGVLPDDEYYIKIKGNEEVIKEKYFNGFQSFDWHDNKDIKKVLDKVPSYEEWKAADNCMLENEVLRLKNARLKDLIQDCQDAFVELLNGYYYGIAGDISREMLDKIDEVLK